MPYKDPERAKENRKQYREKHLEELNANHRKYYQEHKDELRAYQKQYKIDHPEEYKARNKIYTRNHRGIKLSERYGITEEEYNELHTKQGGVCAICGKPETMKQKGTLKHLAVDHDHETGKIRGLLCTKCNASIGQMYEDPILLRKAADYIEYHAIQDVR